MSINFYIYSKFTDKCGEIHREECHIGMNKTLDFISLINFLLATLQRLLDDKNSPYDYYSYSFEKDEEVLDRDKYSEKLTEDEIRVFSDYRKTKSLAKRHKGDTLTKNDSVNFYNFMLHLYETYVDERYYYRLDGLYLSGHTNFFQI